MASFPIPDGAETYTIPTVLFPNGKYVTDSMKVAQYIESQHPSPSIHLDSSYIPKVIMQLDSLMAFGTGLRGVFLPLMPERLLNPQSVDYWMETRSKRIQKPLSQLTEDERGGKAWEHATKPIQEVTRLLKENEGPFFMGKTVSYADFIWAGFLLFWQRIGDDVFNKLVSISGDVEGRENVHLQLLEAVKPWTERSDN
jgi:glutathione S-transferase